MEEFRIRFPGYDVLDKRHSPSWDDLSRKVIGERLEHIPQRRFFEPDQWDVLEAVCSRIIPQPDRPDFPIPLAPFIDKKLHEDQKGGTRYENLPPMQEAWRLGLEGIDDESRQRYGQPFCDLMSDEQDEILQFVQQGNVKSCLWQRLSPERFFKSCLVHDIVAVYYAHPAAWNEIGFGGPASPRGYVRLEFDRRDPWEAEEKIDG